MTLEEVVAPINKLHSELVAKMLENAKDSVPHQIARGRAMALETVMAAVGRPISPMQVEERQNAGRDRR